MPDTPLDPRPDDPSDIGAPPGAPKPIPVTPEMIAEAIRTFDAKEAAVALREVREKGGFKLEDFLPELEKLVPPSANPPAV